MTRSTSFTPQTSVSLRASHVRWRRHIHMHAQEGTRESKLSVHSLRPGNHAASSDARLDLPKYIAWVDIVFPYLNILNLSSVPLSFLRFRSESEALCRLTTNLTNLQSVPPHTPSPRQGSHQPPAIPIRLSTTSYQGNNMKMLFTLGVRSPHRTTGWFIASARATTLSHRRQASHTGQRVTAWMTSARRITGHLPYDNVTCSLDCFKDAGFGPEVVVASDSIAAADKIDECSGLTL